MRAVDDRCRDAILIASLLAIDPDGLGGVWLRVRSPDVQRDFARLLTVLPCGLQKISPTIDDVGLFGGTDLSASLGQGRLIRSEGVLERHSALWLSQSQTAETALSARLSASLDAGSTKILVLADEGCDGDEQAPVRVRERVAFFFHDEGLPVSALRDAMVSQDDIAAARSRLGCVKTGEDAIVRATVVCAELGIGDARVAHFVLKTARALTALASDPAINSDSLETAFRLVLAHRSARSPQDAAEQPEVVREEMDDRDRTGESALSDADMVIEAAEADLPAGLLEQIASAARHGKGKGMGSARLSRLRGRPLPSRRGTLGGRARPDILATLHAAAPWQKLRGAKGVVQIRPEDIRLRRFRERSERVLIFVIDISGSAAMARLAEAKGAATSLLSTAYESRDRVALIGFRRDGAEVLLPPTRSLTRTKRQLSGMAGGGATPLAHGLRAAGDLALRVRGQGLTPHVVLMTDGRANCDLSGKMDREQAARDAVAMAKWLSSERVSATVLDSGLRPSEPLNRLATILGTKAVALKRGASGLSIQTALAP